MKVNNSVPNMREREYQARGDRDHAEGERKWDITREEREISRAR